MGASSELQIGALRELLARERQGALPGNALSRGYTPDSARVGGSLIVDEPREC